MYYIMPKVPKKNVKEGVWKTLVLVVAITTIVNGSTLPAALQFSSAHAQTVPADQVAATDTAAPSNTGADPSVAPSVPTATTEPAVTTAAAALAVPEPTPAPAPILAVVKTPAAPAASPETAGIAIPASAVTLPTPATNPALGQSCGLDIGIAFDVSGSVDSTEMAQMKTAIKTFANAFAGTPTSFSLAKFNSTATVVQPFTSDLDLLKSKVDALPSAGNGSTNWQDGLLKVAGTFDPRPAKANLIVVVTDGSPNTYNVSAGTAYDWTLGLSKAIETANTIKTSGTRIVAIGIGGDVTDPEYPNTDYKLQDISGPTEAPPAAVDVHTDVIKTDFAHLGTAMAQFSTSLCGGKILVQKQLDTNGDGRVDLDGSSTDPRLAGWNFSVSGSPSTPAPQTTTATGALEFSVLNGSYSVTETNVKTDTALASAACLKGTQPIGTANLATRTVIGLTMNADETISCTFVNRVSPKGTLHLVKQVSGGTDPASSWQLHVKSGANEVAGSPQAGSTTGSDYTLDPGTYSVSETGGPAGYAASFSASCPNGQLTVTAEQTTNCTVMNTRDTGTLKIIKVVSGGTDPASSWQLHVKSGANEVAGSPQAGSTTGTSYTLPTGQYAVIETNGPTGYTASFSAACTGGQASVTKGQTTTCTVTNTRDMGTVTFDKFIPGYAESESLFHFHVNGSGDYRDQSSVTLPTGSYTVTEDAIAGYDFSSASGICAVNADGKIILSVTSTGGTCTIINNRRTGAFTVHKQLDANGDGTFESGDAEANALGFRWGLDAETPSRVFGSTSAMLTDRHTITEKALTNYHFVGWFPTGDTQYSCAHPKGTSLPVSADLASSTPTTFTLCNAVDVGTITFAKRIDGAGNANDWHFVVDGSTNVANGGTLTIPVGNHTVAEVGPSGYVNTAVSGTCSKSDTLDGTAQLTVTTTGGTCTFTNAPNTGSLEILKDVRNPQGADTADDTTFYVTVSMSDSTTTVVPLPTTPPGSMPAAVTASLTSLTPQPIKESARLVLHNLPVGTYTIVEQPDSRYVFKSFSRDDNTSLTGAQVTVTRNATTTLQITNQQKPVTVIVHKQMLGIDGITPVSDTHPFHAIVNGVGGTIAVGQDFITQINPGTVTIGESADANYALKSISPNNVAVASGDAPLNVTVTNVQKPATITVSKDVRAWDGSNTADGHTFMVTVGSVTKNFSEGAAATFTVPPGTYSATEIPDANYSLVSVSSPSVTVGSNDVADFTVTNGQNKRFDWTVTKTGPESAHPGDTIIYDIAWHIAGDSNVTLTNLNIVDTLPANTSFVSASNGGIASGNHVTWNLAGPFHPGQTGTVQLKVKVVDHLNSTELTNTADVCADQVVNADALTQDSLTPPPSSTPLRVCKQAIARTTIASSYQLGLQKTDGLTTTSPGSQNTYTITWSTSGSAATTAPLVITDTLPANTAFVAASTGGTANDKIVTWNLGTKAVPATGTVTVTVKVDPVLTNGAVLTNNASLCPMSDQASGGERCVPASDTTTITSSPTLALQKTAPATVTPNQNITYTLSWSIAGNAPATNLTITDTLPANLAFTSASDGGTLATGIITWKLGMKNPGDSGSVSLIAKVNSPLPNGTVITNVASLGATETTPVTSTAKTTVQSSSVLTIAKSNNVSGFTNPGKTVTYTVVVTNPIASTQTADSVSLTDTLPAGLTFVDGGGTTKTFTIGSLPPGAAITTTYNVLVSGTAASGTYTNTATAKGTNTDGVSATSTVEVRIPIVLSATTGPELTIAKKANKTSAVSGDTVTYTVTVKNIGDEDANNVMISDVLPVGFTFTDGGSTKKSWKLDTLKAGRERTIDYEAKIATSVKAGTYKNLATVTSDNAASQHASVSLAVRQPRVLGLATTGARAADYLLFLLGTLMLGFGLLTLRKSRS